MSLKLPQQPITLPAQLTDRWLEEYQENRWLNLGDTSKIELINPFASRTKFEIDNPHIHLLDLMRHPDNFGFTCKILFGLTLAPFQIAILRELWTRPFPMLIGSRGMGKCVRGDTLVHTSRGIVPISDLAKCSSPGEPVFERGLTVLGESGFRDVAYSWNNGVSDTVKLLTRQGYELEGTLNHPIRVVTTSGVEWRELADVRVGDVVPVDRAESWHDNATDLPDDLGYLLGLIAGDGGFTTTSSISFTTADGQLLDAANAVALKYWGKEFVDVPSSKYGYALYSSECRRRLFDEYGFPSSVCAEKDFPRAVLTGPKSACAAFIRGLFDTDGGVESDRVSLSAKSESLVRTLQFVLTRFGIISKRRPKLNKRYGRTYWHLEIRGADAKLFSERIGFGLDRKKESLLRLVSRESNTNRDVVPAVLVEHHLLEISKLCRRKRGQGRRCRELTPSRIRTYGCTHEVIGRVLREAVEHKECLAYRSLECLFNNNLYYDVVEGADSGRCETYDVHVPDGHSFISNGLVSHNSFIVALYAMLRALFNQGSKIVICGAAFRQAKVVFDYCQTLWDNGEVYRDIVGPGKQNGPRRDVDRCSLRVGDSLIVALPLGDGTKIRGQRANIILADEFASIPKEIFETVVRGFAAVSLDPVEKYKAEMRKEALKELGLWTPAHETLESDELMSNQTVISGTAYYAFNHFYEYWKQYKAIVESRGDTRKLEEIFGGEIPDKFNWRDYSVIRIPVRSLPAGFMDEKQIAQAKATVHIGTYQMEYGAVFATDSNGFFKRSLIESCVVGRRDSPVELPSVGIVKFSSVLRGNPTRQYVMGVDPASEQDNFSVVILECWGDHRRIVYCWTTTRSRYKAKAKRGMADGGDFYSYTARKIRELREAFNIQCIAIDAQGGGVAVIEALQDPANLRDGEVPLYPTINPEEAKDTNDLAGDHILEVIQFSKADWVRDANHGLRKDFEDKALLFPYFDPAIVALAHEDDKHAQRVKVDEKDNSVEKLFDTLEDCVMEIEIMKDELATIVHSQTGTSMRDRWDTPETKQAGGKKGRLRKDRYSSLLMANMVGRVLQRTPKVAPYKTMGGFAHEMGANAKQSGPMYVGPAWYTGSVGPSFGAVVKRS